MIELIGEVVFQGILWLISRCLLGIFYGIYWLGYGISFLFGTIFNIKPLSEERKMDLLKNIFFGTITIIILGPLLVGLLYGIITTIIG